jgi:hypothetical protein
MIDLLKDLHFLGSNFVFKSGLIILFLYLFLASDELPTLPRLTYFTDDRLDIVTADESDVLKYLRKENPSKSSGPDVISNHILNLNQEIYKCYEL